MSDDMGAMTEAPTAMAGAPMHSAGAADALTTTTDSAAASERMLITLGGHMPTSMSVLCMVLLVIVASAVWCLRSPRMLTRAKLLGHLASWRLPESLCRPVSLLQLSIQRC